MICPPHSHIKFLSREISTKDTVHAVKSILSITEKRQNWGQLETARYILIRIKIGSKQKTTEIYKIMEDFPHRWYTHECSHLSKYLIIRKGNYKAGNQYDINSVESLKPTTIQKKSIRTMKHCRE